MPSTTRNAMEERRMLTTGLPESGCADVRRCQEKYLSFKQPEG
jgi:hypothetical protein